MFHFYNTCLNISSLFSGGIMISSTGFTIIATILLPINLPALSAFLWIMFLEAVYKASRPVFKKIFPVFVR